MTNGGDAVVACKRCEERGKTWEGADPVCGFDARGAFVEENWNCATLGALREKVEDRYIWNEDDRLGVVVADGYLPQRRAGWDGGDRGPVYVIIRWYKHRGRTDSALWWANGAPRPITLSEAELMLELKK